MKAKFINEASYWNETSKYFAEYEYFWNELVPASGEADTLQGELLRMAARIYHDYFNNGFGNDKSREAHFLEEHQQLFKQYMRDPKKWDEFYDMYEEIAFGSHDELWKNAEAEAFSADYRYGGRGRGYDEEEEEEEDPRDYVLNIQDFIKDNKWDVGGQLDAVIDGIIQYIRLTEDKLIPLGQED